MALKRTYDELEDIPEEHQALYVERDGKYVLDVEAGEGEKNAEDVARALRARDNEKAEREKLRKQLSELQEQMQDIEPERLPQALDALKRLDELEHQKLIDEKKFEEAAEKKFERQIAELNRSITNLKTQVEQAQQGSQSLISELGKERIEGGLQSAFIKAGADPQKVRYLVLDAKNRWELDPETRSPTPIDFIDDGRTKVTATGADGKTLSMDEHVKSILAENQWAMLESTGSNASHQHQSNTNSDFVLTQSEAKDFRKYTAAKAQAEQAGRELTVVPG